MTDVANTVDTYLSAYNEVDPAARRTLLDEAFAVDACLIDPPLDGQGVEGIHTMMGIVHEHYPNHTFRRTSGIEEHHAFVRYGWELLTLDGGVARDTP